MFAMNQMPMPVTTQAMMMAPAEASAPCSGEVVDASADHGADDDAYQADQANFFRAVLADDPPEPEAVLSAMFPVLV
ncbi:MAG: hypothetical protein ACLR3C_00035 [Eggerthella lenta]